MPDPNPDQLSYEDLMAVHNLYQQWQQAGDPRAEKLRTFVSEQGKSLLKAGVNPPKEQEGFWRTFGGDLWNMAKGAAIAGPAGIAAQQAWHGVDELQTIHKTGKSVEQVENERRKAAGYGPGYRYLAAPAGESLGVNATGMEESAAQGDTAGVMGHAAAATTAAAAPLVAEGVVRGGQAAASKLNPRGAMAGRMAEVPPGEEFSRGAVLDAAREHNVNLDVAQATDSRVATVAKKANEFSLTGSPAYKTNAKGNLAALEQWANEEARSYAPGEGASKEMVGGQVQEALKGHLEARKNVATNAFKDLDNTHGGNLIDGTKTIEAEARTIVGENKAYYDAHPELKPKQAWSIIENLAERPKVNTVTPGTVAEGLVDAAGEPITPENMVTKQPARMHVFNWSELHQLRSDLMDFYRNNPDVIKGRAESWIQRMVGKIDDSMTHASAGLSPEDLTKFRDANAVWESIKQTYDNPQSPYYHAIRTQYASQVPGMLTKGTPELARSVRDTLGSLEGPFQRQFVENLINDKNGNLDLGKLDSKISRHDNDFLHSMLGEEGTTNLKLLGKVARKVMADANPSGTAKVGQPAAEVAGWFKNPIAGSAEMGAQYGVSKLMNSPRFVDFLTDSEHAQPSAPATRTLPPRPPRPGGANPLDSPPGSPQNSAREAGNGPTAPNPAERPGGASAPVPGPVQTGGPAATGTETSVRVPGESRSYQAQYQLRELEDLRASHSGVSFRKNPQYELVNDRDYTQGAEQGKVFNASVPGKFDPSFHVTDNPDATNGPAVIDSTGNVLGGNGRTMILERVYRFNPDGAAAYKKLLADKAAQFGIDPADVATMKRPVLVRQIADSEFEQANGKQNAITDFNKKGTADLSPAQQAAADARRVSQSLLDEVAMRMEMVGPEAGLTDVLKGNGGVQLLNRLINDGVITSQERPKLANTEGLTDIGRKRISDLMVARFFRDPTQIETTPIPIRNKLERMAAPLSRTEGIEGWNLMPDVQQAMDLLEETRARGAKTIDDLTQQEGLFGNTKYSDRAIAIAKKLQSDSQTKMAQAAKKYVTDAVDSQRGLFGGGVVTSDQAFDEAFRPAAKEAAEPSLFDQPATTPAAEGAVQRFLKDESGELRIPLPKKKAAPAPTATPTARITYEAPNSNPEVGANEHKFVLHDEQGRDIGHVILHDDSAKGTPKRFSVIDAVVKPDYRGKGLGTQLYQAAADFAHRQGSDLVSSFRPSSDAARVWNKLGAEDLFDSATESPQMARYRLKSAPAPSAKPAGSSGLKITDATESEQAALAKWKAIGDKHGKESRAAYAGDMGNSIANEERFAEEEGLGIGTPIVAKDAGGKVVGAAYIGDDEAINENGAENMHVHYIATHPDLVAAGKPSGIGTALMREVAKRAAAAGLGVRLEAFNDSPGFYRKLGMKEIEPGTFAWTPAEAKTFAASPARAK